MERGRHILVGDIGGTNGRFALADDDLTLVEAAAEQGDDHDAFPDALDAYLQKSGVRADVAAFAVAGPVVDGRPTRLTNRRNWAVDASEIERRFGLSRVVVMNDFVAQAASLPHLSRREVTRLGPVDPPDDGLKVAVGPGTGIGVAALAPLGGEWLPLQGEGGHVELAATDEREWDAFKIIRADLGRVEAEAVLCGPGLVRLHAALARLDGAAARETSPAEIVAAAERGERRARETVDRFVAILGRFCGDLALTFAAYGGVFICGGIAPKLLGLIDQTSFRAGFEAKRPYADMMRSIATCVVTAPSAGLVGCAAEARRRLAGRR